MQPGFRMLFLFAPAGLLLGCTQRARPPVPSHRPWHMPCAIGGERQHKDDTDTTLYRLYYGQDGQLAAATERYLASDCKNPDLPCKLTNSPKAVLRYKYEEGRLTEVRRTFLDSISHGMTSVLSITYSQGRPERYSLRPL